jgi:hypothetical protein
MRLSCFRHGSVEHDASISRADFFFGDNHSFNETIYSAMAESNPGVDYYNGTSTGKMQKRRLAESQATNPNITNTIKEFQTRSQEAAFALSIFGDVKTGVAPKK